jgi:hypothetical protein
MRATEGAIEGVQLGETVELQVIGGDVPALGICGSGLVDAVAQLLHAGLLDHSGRMKGPGDMPGHPLADRLIEIDGCAFLLADGVYLSQRDVREPQFAKGSIATGIWSSWTSSAWRRRTRRVLWRFVRLLPEPDSAKIIGLVPPVDVDKIIAVGNRPARGRRSRRCVSRAPVALSCLRARVRRAVRARTSTTLSCQCLDCTSGVYEHDCIRHLWRARRRGRTLSIAGGWDVDIYGLSAMLHLYPKRIVEELGVKLRALRPRYEKLVVVYGDCGTAGRLEPLLDEMDAARVRGPHCYEMLAGEDLFQQVSDEKPGTFFLTDWLVRNFDRAVVRGLGLDRDPELKSMIFGNYEALLYLRQVPNCASRSKRRR